MSRFASIRALFLGAAFLGASVCLLGLAATTASAGDYNPVLSVGDKAPSWKDLPGIDGKKHSLDDLKDKDIVVLCFTCNSCDVAKDYEDRIVKFAEKFAGPKSKTALVAVNVNKIPADSLAEMKKRAEAKKFPFMYLYDETQKIAKDYGATFTPEFFVINRERRIAYMGGFDDHSSAPLAKKHYLEEAVQQVAQGKQPTTKETVAIGCMIRYERERRKK